MTLHRIKIAKTISIIVILAGIAVIIGWIFNIPVLKSISPAWVNMKIITAITFVLSGIVLYFAIEASQGNLDKAQVVLAVTAMTIILFMGIVFFSIFFGIYTGIEDMFILEPPGTVKTVAPGRPSIPTMLNFCLIAAAGILTIWNMQSLRTNLKIISLIIIIISIIAIIGYILNNPLLYYFIEGKNSAIACHTAVLFLLLGAGFLCLSD